MSKSQKRSEKSQNTAHEYAFIDSESLNKLGKKIDSLIDNVGSLVTEIDSSNLNQSKLLEELKTSNENHDKLLKELKTSNENHDKLLKELKTSNDNVLIQMQASNQAQVNFLNLLAKKFFPEEKESKENFPPQGNDQEKDS